MVCAQCGNTMEQQERFCSKCGKDSTLRPQAAVRFPRPRNWDTHVRVVAWFFIIGACFAAIPAAAMFFAGGLVMGTATFPPVMFAPMFGFFSLLFLLIPAGIAAAGIGLLQYKEWARILTIIMSIFMLIAIPFGTALGIYALWVLLSDEGSHSYKSRSEHAMA